MKVLERNVVRLAVVQHLRSVYGIKIKNWNKNRNKQTSTNTLRVFGIALETLPLCHVLDYGDVPCFLVDACTILLDYLDTEGLFRKSGSVLRVKSLRTKLEQGEHCLSSALPLDIAGLLKQFFRELPEPILITDLHSAFLKAQELTSDEERTSATVLLSCVLPDRNLNTLRYFFSFLKSVSQRCAENKMDSSNLALIFAPNLFHAADGGEKMSSSTEKRLKHQAAAVQCLIENAQGLGVVPQFLMEKVPAMLGCDAGVFSPSSLSLEDGNAHSDPKKSNRRSLGVFSMATPVIMTPNSKRKLPQESANTFGFSNKKRRSIKKNLGLELLPNVLFGGMSTPGSAQSPAGVLDSPHSGLLSSASKNTRLSSSSARRKSRRLRVHSVSRVESGKAGCFSPRVSKKEPVRKSLRLRFSLGKSNRESNLITHSHPGPKGSEAIGWRLATQESSSGFHFSKEFSSAFISKSEDNLSMPHIGDPMSSRKSVTPDEALNFPPDSFSEMSMSLRLKTGYQSQPAITVSQSPLLNNCRKTCSAADGFTEERSQAGATLLKIKQANIQSPVQEQTNDDSVDKGCGHVETMGLPISELANEPNVTFGQIEIVPLSPLHIDTTLFDGEPTRFMESSFNGSLCLENESRGFLKERSGDCSQLIDALDIQSPMPFRLLDSSNRVQSTPYPTRTQLMQTSPFDHEGSLFIESKINCSPDQEKYPSNTESRRMKVAEQVKRFNMMTLESPKVTVARSPLKFQRTPVLQSVRRINSLVGNRKDNRMGWCAASQMKAVSLESGLQASIKKPKPPVPPKKASLKLKVLEDVTNKAPKVNNNNNNVPKSVLLLAAKTDNGHYRGSPKNPLTEGRLMSATKPIDL
ncbi:hypothetical protein DNTS_016278 [Danionella cerebrum]|uniref:Rho-GAP domain-containing protein n=1 Tax=Danionella cerebrum TaxID=2873325 RepID=A0A553Q0V8_9TELE|nr:hypothetical protein DNTS_016278 [Danionella translucida]